MGDQGARRCGTGGSVSGMKALHCGQPLGLLAKDPYLVSTKYVTSAKVVAVNAVGFLGIFRMSDGGETENRKGKDAEDAMRKEKNMKKNMIARKNKEKANEIAVDRSTAKQTV